MQIIELNISEIKQYKKNAKLHPDWQVEQIVSSIEKFGFNDPIAIDENNTIIEGHGRYLAAKKLNLEVVPCIKLDHMTEQEKKAYILAHNKLTMNTEFDLDILKNELEELDALKFDIGFEAVEIESLLANEEDDSFLDIADDGEYDEGNSKVLNGLVCPDCGARHKVSTFLECEISG